MEIKDISHIKLSEDFKQAVKREFEQTTAKVVLILNQGGIRKANIELEIN